MAGWHHRLNGHEFEQAPGVGDGQGSNGNTETLFWGAPKSLQMVTVTMKLKDACSLEEKL